VGAGTQGVLVDDVQGRAEAPGQLVQPAAGDNHRPVGVPGRARREQAEQIVSGRGRTHGTLTIGLDVHDARSSSQADQG
jgi:hypothetical protein